MYIIELSWRYYFDFLCTTNPVEVKLPIHEHPMSPLKDRRMGNCCGVRFKAESDGYYCSECDYFFHKTCSNAPESLDHSSRNFFDSVCIATYTGKSRARCDFCKEKITRGIQHYSSSGGKKKLIHLECAKYPPPEAIDVPQSHDHKLNLKKKQSCFTCAACGKDGDGCSYKCDECHLTFHVSCKKYPAEVTHPCHPSHPLKLFKVCGICQKEMDWSCGGYSCLKCPKSVFHTKCATRKDVSDRRERKDDPEEDEEIKPFKVVDESTNTIQHFLHEKHNLRLDKSGIFIDKRTCKACLYPIYRHSFYSCIKCSFMLHESCAEMPTRRRHMVSNKLYTLQKSHRRHKCEACGVCNNGSAYSSGDDRHALDVRCASVSEPFLHQSHPEHPLFYTSPQGVCSACKKEAFHVLRCVVEGCGYVLDFKCALLPYQVKHRVDDHLLSLCYGEKDAPGIYWCDICEEETDSRTWFYTCKDCGFTLHIGCMLGDFRSLEPGAVVTWADGGDGVQSVAVRNKRMSRPFCNQCKLRCVLPVILKVVGTGKPFKYYCSFDCFEIVYPDSSVDQRFRRENPFVFSG
ncbi:unnamed protein product [Microthlaspi erraticum]|uniref:Phorbol-ester/DAG-type domain-containing protein n=1 Tax=Microthlaspi erraticum TaxID=1685480 RepID=A0A6D2HVN5_9BRAS|nr:unnamed protein product [Microthlaspi erraticum]